VSDVQRLMLPRARLIDNALIDPNGGRDSYKVEHLSCEKSGENLFQCSFTWFPFADENASMVAHMAFTKYGADWVLAEQ